MRDAGGVEIQRPWPGAPSNFPPCWAGAKWHRGARLRLFRDTAHLISMFLNLQFQFPLFSLVHKAARKLDISTARLLLTAPQQDRGKPGAKHGRPRHYWQCHRSRTSSLSYGVCPRGWEAMVGTR